MDRRFFSNGGDNDFRANDEGWEGTSSYRPKSRTSSRVIVTESQTLKTFDQWKDEGRYVKKGSKSTSQNVNGQPLFHITQVR